MPWLILVTLNSNNQISFFSPSAIQFHGALREYQEQCCSNVVSSFNKQGSALIQRVVDLEKLVWPSTYACVRQVLSTLPVLIVVHTCCLQTQWKERISQFMPHWKVALYGGGSQTKVDKFSGTPDVVIAMIQTLTSRKMHMKASIVCFDECHHIAAESMLRSLNLISSRYVLGLSATPKRNDGLERVVLLHFS